MPDDSAAGGAPQLHVAIDTGGTHTDLVLLEAGGGRLFTHKVPSTLHDLSEGILEGMRQ
ncbi:MAG: hypothetical protein IT561_01120, partial [Alphaproteobacteria bacterium]|nr:hypothetical protein [Alphaproteobacteria bacterium]